MKIQQFPYTHLATPNLDGVAKRLAAIFGGFPKEEARPAIEAFVEKANEFNASTRQIMASPHSYNLKEIEPERDRLLGLFSKMVTDATKSRNDELKEAGNQVSVVLRTYKKTAKMPIDQQTIVTRKLLRDLYANGTDTYLRKIAGAKEVATQIENLNDVFEDLYNARTTNREGVEKRLTIRLRRELIEKLRAAVEVINAVKTLYSISEVDDIIKSANAILEQARINLANRNKKK